MFSRRFSRNKMVKDLTRTRHMTAVSAVVLATTFMPLLGIPDLQEMRAFQDAVEGFSDARAHVLAPRRDDEAARERSARSVIPERFQRGAMDQTGPTDELLAVERPDQPSAEMIEAAVLPPLPSADDDGGMELMAPVEAEEIVPAPAEQPALEPLTEEEPVDEKEPADVEDE
jgi:hypothetical protein